MLQLSQRGKSQTFDYRETRGSLSLTILCTCIEFNIQFKSPGVQAVSSNMQTETFYFISKISQYLSVALIFIWKEGAGATEQPESSSAATRENIYTSTHNWSPCGHQLIAPLGHLQDLHGRILCNKLCIWWWEVRVSPGKLLTPVQTYIQFFSSYKYVRFVSV